MLPAAFLLPAQEHTANSGEQNIQLYVTGTQVVPGKGQIVISASHLVWFHVSPKTMASALAYLKRVASPKVGKASQ